MSALGRLLDAAHRRWCPSCRRVAQRMELIRIERARLDAMTERPS